MPAGCCIFTSSLHTGAGDIYIFFFLLHGIQLDFKNLPVGNEVLKGVPSAFLIKKFFVMKDCIYYFII